MTPLCFAWAQHHQLLPSLTVKVRVRLEDFPRLLDARLSVTHGPALGRLRRPCCGRSHSLSSNSQRSRHSPLCVVVKESGFEEG